MNGPILAHVRRILSGHSDRALIHAVNDAGHEYKLEVPSEAVRGIDSGHGVVLMVSWSLLALPRAAEPAAAPTGAQAGPTPSTTAPASTPTPTNAIDAEFMALMARTRQATPEPTTVSPTAASAAGPEHQIAALLGLAPNRAT
jgi:hypothetical protein